MVSMKKTLADSNNATTKAPLYSGLRLNADQYHALEADGFLYELVDGVVILSPSPNPRHQQVLVEIAYQIKAFLKLNPIGSLYAEVDVKFTNELVYRPELVFLRRDRVRQNWERISESPDLIVEIISPESRRYDRETKKDDYQRYGVQEYWLIDPIMESLEFYRLEQGRFVEMAPHGERLASNALIGFELDLTSVRNAFQPL